ncbi:uncharacterized protein LOC126679516 [Mercurialis annua]|uniref:uncharacterized protein LOC126679516 n=1 Tax=Mercurialis annua TaxID=3986 RepID=UPI0021609268|nr:uncharacterized protein LOC126679516 [Mercurialis annua]
MSSPKATIHDPFKAWKFLVFPNINKATDFCSFIIKTIMIICTILSIFVFFYFSFSYQFQWLSCPEFDRVSFSGHRKLTKNSMSANIHQETNVTHILFGIGGSATTWEDRRHYSELWWRPNITRGYVWLEEPPQETYSWPATSPPYKVSENTSRFKYTCSYGSRSALHIARIVKESFELGLDNVRWFVMGDDDTVFFVENLVKVLAKYDHNQMYYIGGNSESVEQDVIHSYNMGYGGGGFAISYSLAKELVRVLDGCIDRYHKFYGSDQKVQACIAEIGVPLTKELGFHQLDIRGNPYGLLAAHPLAPLVSLHHLDYVHSIFPGMNRVDSLRKLVKPYQMDPGRMLQHTICHDLTRNWSVSVSWGYTIQLYPSIVTAKQLETAFQTFQTWRSWSNDPFTFNTRPMSKDPCERPVVYFLDGIVENVVGQGQGLTRYKRHVEDGETSCDRPEYGGVETVQFINVTTTSRLNYDIWNLAPRRQCCQIIHSGENIEVKIRGCNPFESVTPP